MNANKNARILKKISVHAKFTKSCSQYENGMLPLLILHIAAPDPISTKSIVHIIGNTNAEGVPGGVMISSNKLKFPIVSSDETAPVNSVIAICKAYVFIFDFTISPRINSIFHATHNMLFMHVLIVNWKKKYIIGICCGYIFEKIKKHTIFIKKSVAICQTV